MKTVVTILSFLSVPYTAFLWRRAVLSIFSSLILPNAVLANPSFSCDALFKPALIAEHDETSLSLKALSFERERIESDKSLGDWPQRHEIIKAQLYPRIAKSALKSFAESKSVDEILGTIELLDDFYISPELSLEIKKIDFQKIFRRLNFSESQYRMLRESLKKRTWRAVDNRRRGLEQILYFIDEQVARADTQTKIASFLNKKSKQDAVYTLGFMTWMANEALENHERMVQPLGWIRSETTAAPQSEVKVRVVEGYKLPAEFKRVLFKGSASEINWPSHPRNTVESVPFRPGGSYASTAGMDLHYTASRSMVVRGTTLSLKLATNHPTPNENNPTKADLRNSVKVSMTRGNLVRRVDRRSRQDPKLIVLYDVAAFVDDKTGNGFTVRDLSAFNNGNNWLPSSSIPTLGARIAGTSTLHEARDFWIEHYVKPIARAKALLLLRYGVQLKFPHLQNSVTEYTTTWKPTDAIAIRDLSDSSFVRPIAEVIAPQELKEDLANGFQVLEHISPALGDNSKHDDFRRTSVGSLGIELVQSQLMPGLPEEGARHWHTTELKRLEDFEEKIFIDVVRFELGIRQTFRDVADLQSYLFSREGLNKIRVYHRLADTAPL